MKEIEIDLVPYEVTREGRYTVLHGVGGSLLANLDNDPAVTGDRGSDEYEYAIHPETFKPIHVKYDPESETFAIECGFEAAKDWLEKHLDAVESIGWEALHTREGAEKMSASLPSTPVSV